MSRKLFLQVGAYLVVGAVGCGGTSNGGSTGNGSSADCQTVTPCGGDVTGTWKVTGVCNQVQAADLGDSGVCPGEMFQLSILDYEGTVTFSGGSFSTTFTKGVIGETFTEPTSCFGTNTTAQTCDQVSMALAESDAGVSGSCSISGNNCVCSGTMTLGSQSSSGTYSTSGTSITLTVANSGNGPETDGYCVQGSTTLYVNPNAAAAMTGTTAFGGLVLTKQ